MTKTTKKKINIVIVVALISMVVILLYPYGNKLLMMVRTHDSLTTYGKEIIYSNINDGDLRVADEVLENKYEISRFSPVVIEKQTWKEDPYSDIYWRFNYYNLEPVRNLLYAWVNTNKSIYKDKLIEIVNSFLDSGVKGPYSWDYHGTAFRTMTLINVREKLLEKNELSPELDKKILDTLKMHGDFLANPAHFEKEYNHGLDQAAALYLLAVNYPDMPNAATWLKLSSARIIEMQSGIVDEDGILVENSPYYHLYVLEKFLEIDKYLKQNNLSIEGYSDEKINKMISYVVYMLQPDLTVPTIGASIKRQVNLFGPYKEVVKTHPDLLYVLTKGAEGTKPTNLNIQYPISGETIMRSGWEHGKDFLNQTQLIFDVGNYRTNHSDLDALSFNLFGNGIALMPDSGLYTYEPGPYRSYFHGTKSHNTVVVDGKDQSIGTGSNKVISGSFKQGDGYVYQSGQSSLYEGVSHERAIVMIEDSTVIILDNLKSSSEHTYEQMFHLFPNAKINLDGLNLKAQGEDKKQALNIKQFVTNGLVLHTAINENNPINGVCSFEYTVATPCYSISYVQKGKNVSYVTAIGIGQNTTDIQYNSESKLLKVKTKNGEYNIKISETNNIVRNIEVNKKFDISKIYAVEQPADSLNALSEWANISGIDVIKNGGNVSVNSKENSLDITTPSDGSSIDVARNANIDLSNQNIYFKIKIDKTMSLHGLDISLSNNNWSKEATFYLKGSTYDISRDGEWIQFGVRKGDLRKIDLGNWEKTDLTFDWSKIDAIKFSIRSTNSQNVVLNIKDFNIVPDQKQARAVIIFDDGWSSVMDAAKIMNKYGLKGNVAVITGSVDKKQYLTLDNLKTLQNDFGWNMVSHSSLHKDAVRTYVDKNDLAGFENDITDALQYFIQNNINFAPNWYIYPDGSTDGAIKTIIDKYYKFARATVNVPEAFPFADPLEIGVFPVYSDRAEPIDVHNAVSDAVKYNQTIFLMFHKFSTGTPAVYTEWQLSKFDEVLKDIKNQGIKVVTLSELDNENNVPETEFILHKSFPAQLNLDISVKRTLGIIQNIQNFVINKWKNLKNL